MALTPEAVRRFGRQIALPEIGAEGQQRFLAAEVALVGDGTAVTTAQTYLLRAGVGRTRVISRDGGGPADGSAWMTALRGASVVIRSGFEDDAMLNAAIRLGIPAVVMRTGVGGIDLIAFRRQGPCPHAPLDFSRAPAVSAVATDEAAAVLAGTLAATEALWILAHPEAPPRARHLRLPLDGGSPLAQDIPWTPECFVCGGSGQEASFQ